MKDFDFAYLLKETNEYEGLTIEQVEELIKRKENQFEGLFERIGKELTDSEVLEQMKL